MLVIASACSAPEPVRVFDACEPLRVDVDDGTRIAAVDAAIASWQAVGVMTVSRDAATDNAVAVRFGPASPTEFGLYTGSAIDINEDLSGDELAIVIAHEIGHAIGLVHIDPQERTSVMNAGNLITEPTGDDDAAVVALWGRCH